MAKVEVKQPIVDKIAEEIKDAQSVVLVDYRGLTVAQDTELRKQLREAGVIYKVYKNTMMKRAFEGTEFAALDDCLEGPSAIAISKDDATAPARILYKFAQDAPALELKGGVVEGTAYDVAGISELAKIPSRDELLSKLLGSLQSPITNFARVIKQIAEQGGEAAASRSTQRRQQQTQSNVRQLIWIQTAYMEQMLIQLIKNENEKWRIFKMAKLTTAEMIEAIKELSVLELNELVKACEEEFGVSAAAGVVVAAAAGGCRSSRER